MGSNATQAFTLVVTSGAGHHQRQYDDVRGGQRRLVRVHRHRHPGAGDRGHRHPAGGRDLQRRAPRRCPGTPGAGTGGSYALTVTASNGVGSNATQAFTLVVNQAPAITSANSATFKVAAAGTATVTAYRIPTAQFERERNPACRGHVHTRHGRAGRHAGLRDRRESIR